MAIFKCKICGGTIAAVGNYDNGQCNVSDWENIRQPNQKKRIISLRRPVRGIGRRSLMLLDEVFFCSFCET